MRKGTVILQSCAVSPEVVPDSCSGTSITSSDDTHAVISIKVEVYADVTMKVEEIPEPLSFPAVKAEPDEVSYLSVCPLLDKCHEYPRMHSVFHDLHFYICSVKQLHYVEWEFQSFLGLCESLVREHFCM